jgi:dTDP-glucose pyrophosphorylase
MITPNQTWRSIVLPSDAKIRDAINVLNKSGLRIVLVIDNDETFLGTITDGDIRGGLLKGLDIEKPLENILNRKPIVVPEHIASKKVKQLMSVNKIQQIPIVDEQQRLVGLHLWDQVDLPILLPNIFVIMVGGKGTRLGKQTENCPKPLLLVSGKPILEHIINRAKSQGFTHFVLAIHHLGHMIEEYFGDGDKFGVQIEYLREKTALGTAGALSLLVPIPNLPIVVTNGDVLADVQYDTILEFHKSQNAVGTMAVRVHEWKNPFGVVKTEGEEIIGYEEKPIVRSIINAGIYVLDSAALNYLGDSEPCDMPSLFEIIRAKNHKIVAYSLHENWFDIGNPIDLQEATNKHSDAGTNK